MLWRCNPIGQLWGVAEYTEKLYAEQARDFMSAYACYETEPGFDDVSG